ncbi:AMP-binding protein [Chelatococcus reniformis]|uniref:ATP-dependent acyl-CoA ligase n=1 Tax=Chelatococcus reniformis TaxID=1494448 RepID=A0A916USR8_9HYPH|nr:AMP-binding protein [Chelatococcus reniformis]GGC86562.1 ATP-dependent acyl-CoA ligase [Chelatococcus reniformis]
MLDKRMPPRNDVVIRDLIDRRAREIPDNVFAVLSDGSEWTFGELRRRVRNCAEALQRLGAGQGDFVLVWLPNGPTCLEVMFALNYLGAIYVPINTGYRGGLLAHVIDNAGAKLMIADAQLVERLADVSHADLRTVVVVGGGAREVPGLTLLDQGVLVGDGEALAPPQRQIEPWDTLSIIYTSGTTGPSKGVLISALQMYATFIPRGVLEPEDRTLVTLPMFHVGGAGPIWSTLMRGGSFALTEAFRTSEFWSTIRRFGITHTILLGAMTPFLLKEPASAEDRTHPLTKVSMIPLTDQHREFTARFGIEVYTGFNMTETSSPLHCGPDPASPGTCGQPRDGIEARVVDENDCEVGPGVVGELILRADMPFALNHGYHKNPEATAKAWRNGWFHTGDAFRRDEEGSFYFVDRMKDAIRRRGENISSFEVEKEIVAYEDVRDAAVVAVPSEFGEDEVMAILSPAPGRNIDLPALVEFLRPRLAHFMVPRYFRVIDDLPRTPTEKVQKHLLRSEGITPDTWDREKAGIVLKRERLTQGTAA